MNVLNTRRSLRTRSYWLVGGGILFLTFGSYLGPLRATEPETLEAEDAWFAVEMLGSKIGYLQFLTTKNDILWKSDDSAAIYDNYFKKI